MNEEERRRICIITGVCPPSDAGAAPLSLGERADLLEKDLSEGQEKTLDLHGALVILLGRYGLSWQA